MARDRSAVYVDEHGKVCRACRKYKPFSEFHRQPNGIGGVKHHCKDCYNAGVGAEMCRRQRERAAARRIVLDATKPSRKCRVCGDKKPRAEFRRPDGTEYPARECSSCYQQIRDKLASREQEALAYGGTHRKRSYLLRLKSDGSLTKDVVCGLFAAAKTCPYCGGAMKSRDKSLDHFIPLALGGWHRVGNVIVCCRSCNSRKQDMDPLAFFVALTALHLG